VGAEVSYLGLSSWIDSVHLLEGSVVCWSVARAAAEISAVLGPGVKPDLDSREVEAQAVWVPYPAVSG
jgi:hypothetical protein